MSTTKKLMTAFVMGLTLVASAGTFVSTASAQSVTADTFGVSQIKATGLPDRDFRIVVSNIIKALLGLIATVMVVIMLYAGFLWMTAGGNEDQTAQAKAWITGSAIGLAIILMAYALTSFIINQLVAATTGTGTTGSGL